MNDVQYKLSAWVDTRKIDWWYLSSNPRAVKILKSYLHKVKWLQLSANPEAIDLLTENFFV